MSSDIKSRHWSPIFILILVAAPTVLVATCAAALYYALGKLETGTLQALACGSICIGPTVAIASAIGSWTFFNAFHKKLDKTAETTLDRAERIFKIVGDGLGHSAVARARVNTPPAPVAQTAMEPYWRPVIERGQIVDGDALNLSRSAYHDE